MRKKLFALAILLLVLLAVCFPIFFPSKMAPPPNYPNMKLNLGCGSQVPDGWVNVDYALGARFAKIPFFRALNKKFKLFDLDWDEKIYLHDLTKRFPWADCSVDVVYCSHILEHFPRDHGHRFLTECHRVLRTNGMIRILVPDLQYYVNEYREGRIQADHFVEKLGVLYEGDTTGLKKLLAPFIEFPHKCMYDEVRLIEILGQIGFEVARRAAFDSDISDIRVIELEGRTVNAVIVEGRKR